MRLGQLLWRCPMQTETCQERIATSQHTSTVDTLVVLKLISTVNWVFPRQVEFCPNPTIDSIVIFVCPADHPGLQNITINWVYKLQHRVLNWRSHFKYIMCHFVIGNSSHMFPWHACITSIFTFCMCMGTHNEYWLITTIPWDVSGGSRMNQHW